MAYTARVLQICDDAQTVLKDRGGGEFEDATIVLYINDCLHELERRGAFKKLGYVNGVIDTYAYTLSSTLTDLVAPISVGWKASTANQYRQLEMLHSMQQYLNCRESTDQYTEIELNSSYYAPTYALFEGANLYVWPAPTESVTSGFEVWYRNSETRITDSIELPTPAAWDIMFTFWAVYMGFLTDIPSRNSPEMANAYRMRAEEKISAYLDSMMPQRLVLRTDR